MLRRRANGETVEGIQPDLLIPTGRRKGQNPSLSSIYRALAEHEKTRAYPEAVETAHADFAALQQRDRSQMIPTCINGAGSPSAPAAPCLGPIDARQPVPQCCAAAQRVQAGAPHWPERPLGGSSGPGRGWRRQTRGAGLGGRGRNGPEG
ncbi:hypothetical protein OG616_38530 [Streptomyces antibioticus]|uniref:hypothetical protein n=1 Tax=Streptomyces antibioticus TaxID=1890 RepID=UPI002250068A|nr:hypothetical protein [Streptomyces antibioticus]MCX5173885.1 hypothetical protein [Streptomyces antibioticus]